MRNSAGTFDEWFSKQKPGLFPKDFLFWDGSGFRWLYLYEDGMDVPKEFEIGRASCRERV